MLVIFYTLHIKQTRLLKTDLIYLYVLILVSKLFIQTHTYNLFGSLYKFSHALMTD